MVGRRLQPPSWQHWLGTDALGRDVLSRTLHGARHSLPIAVVVVALAVAIGATLGAITGFLGGLADGAIMRLVDVTLSFPPILLAMAVDGLARARAVECGHRHGHRLVADLRPADARPGAGSVSASMWRRPSPPAPAAAHAYKHILPLCWTPDADQRHDGFRPGVLLAASLSFIGLGATPPTPEWGSDDLRGRAKFYHWWIAFGPGMAILTVVARLQLPRRRPARLSWTRGRNDADRMDEPLLAIRDLEVAFARARGHFEAVRGVDLDVRPWRGAGHRRRIRLAARA